MVNLFLSVLYESASDFDGSMLDNVRVQCDGLGNILYTDNPFARVVRNGCLLYPDTLQEVMSAFLIFTMEYPIMACACKQTTSANFEKVVSERCMHDTLPAPYQVVLANMRDDAAGNAGRKQMCFAIMDLANSRLEHVFDSVFARMLPRDPNR